MTISIIIPTLNEAARIRELLLYLFALPSQDALSEVIVVDGGSVDATRDIAQQAGARVLTAPQKGRAAQMNFAAQAARGESFISSMPMCTRRQVVLPISRTV